MSDAIRFILPKKPRLFRYSAWDTVPIFFGLLHFIYLFSLYFVFTCVHLPLAEKAPLMAVMGIVYAFSISWNINGISHNFIHNRYFNSPLLNRFFSIIESIDCIFSQVIYDYIHRCHHMGNADKPEEPGKTIDPLSIYRHGHEGHAENVWTYTFMSFFREDPKAAYRGIKKKDPVEARWAIVEIVIIGSLMITATIVNWRFMAFFLPFWYFGHCLSYLNGYYEHFGGNPDIPMAWGVSSYHRLYNFIWFNNGYHAEHHYRPRADWTRMKTLKDQIEEDQKRVGVRVLHPPHVLGFCDPDVCDEPLVKHSPSNETNFNPSQAELADVTASEQPPAAGANA